MANQLEESASPEQPESSLQHPTALLLAGLRHLLNPILIGAVLGPLIVQLSFSQLKDKLVAAGNQVQIQVINDTHFAEMVDYTVALYAAVLSLAVVIVNLVMVSLKLCIRFGMMNYTAWNRHHFWHVLWCVGTGVFVVFSLVYFIGGFAGDTQAVEKYTSRNIELGEFLTPPVFSSALFWIRALGVGVAAASWFLWKKDRSLPESHRLDSVQR